MGVFLPTKIKGDIILYSKWCVECDYPDELQAINTYATRHDLELQIIRTAYRPADHDRATEIWGCRDGVSEEDAESYSAFVPYKDKIYTLEEFTEMIGDDVKNKMIKEGETKDDMQDMPRAKRNKRKTRVDVAADGATAEDKEQPKE